jgi:signal transduction histidine kinase
VVSQFVTFLFLFMIIFCIIMTCMLFKLANAITRPVIELYELIKHIVNHGKGKKMKLSFKYTNDELNNLHKTFNKLATTL